MNAKEELVIKFQEIKERGWIETKRHGDQCLGNTFEDLIFIIATVVPPDRAF